jgi:hypothetical protein
MIELADEALRAIRLNASSTGNVSFLPQTRINYSAADGTDLGLKHSAKTSLSGQQFARR